MPENSEIAIIGLGYVGLPLAVALARHFDVIGFDVDAARITALRKGDDRTGEVDSATLSASTLALSGDPSSLRGRGVLSWPCRPL